MERVEHEYLLFSAHQYRQQVLQTHDRITLIFFYFPTGVESFQQHSLAVFLEEVLLQYKHTFN